LVAKVEDGWGGARGGAVLGRVDRLSHEAANDMEEEEEEEEEERESLTSWIGSARLAGPSRETRNCQRGRVAAPQDQTGQTQKKEGKRNDDSTRAGAGLSKKRLL